MKPCAPRNDGGKRVVAIGSFLTHRARAAPTRMVRLGRIWYTRLPFLG